MFQNKTKLNYTTGISIIKIVNYGKAKFVEK